MTIKMRSGLNLTNSQSPKIQMRKIIVSRGSHRQVIKEHFLNNGNSVENHLKFNNGQLKTAFFQEELLMSSQSKSNLLNNNQQAFNLNSSRFKKKSETRLSSSLSRIKNSRGLSAFSNNPQDQKCLNNSKGSSFCLRRDSIIQREQTNMNDTNKFQITNIKPQMTVEIVQKSLKQLQQKLEELIKQKLHHLQNQLKLKKVLQSSSMATEKQQQSLLKLVQTQQFELIQEQILKVQKALSQINLDAIKNQQNQNQDTIIKLAQKKSKIIQKIMAQRMVQSELYKKYYMGTRSIDKSRQYRLQNNSFDNHDSHELLLNRNKISSQNKSPKKVQQIQSLSKISYKKPKNEDYQTYRYKQPLYKPNLQPLPRSVYKAQYLKSSTNEMNKKCSFIQNIIFGHSQRSKSSNYRDSFNPIRQKHQLVNHRQLDAYKDKFRDIKLSYIPKKRTHTQEANRKIKKHHTTDYLKQLKSTKLFALQSQRSTYEMKGLESIKQGFLTQIKREYQGSPCVKSQIKHKQLNNFRYQFKKMFHS